MESRIEPLISVDFNEENQELVIIDQTLLPGELKHLHLKNQQDVYQAIYLLQVRGAPAIGVAAAFGLYLAVAAFPENDEAGFFNSLDQSADYLISARPTAVNLAWAVERLKAKAHSLQGEPVFEIKKAILTEAKAIREEDVAVCRTIGENGLSLLQPHMGLLTHCNAGQLATIRYGTALAPIYLGQEQGYNFRVFIDETRPFLQGARLTAFEMANLGVDATLICDNMAATVMQKGWIDAILVGADRVTRNGDTANKVGTLGLAVLAEMFNIPFYVFAPSSSIDQNTFCGEDIVIEERPAAEIREMWYRKPMVPDGVKIYNPAFDVTPNQLITAIITEKGIIHPPFINNLREIF